MAKARPGFVTPAHVLGEVYGKTSLQLKMSEKRRDEVIAAAIWTCFRNQEFGTRYKMSGNYKEVDHEQDARGVDVVIAEPGGRQKKLQIKGVHIKRSIQRRKKHATKGTPRVLGYKTLRYSKRDSAELTKMMKEELLKIHHDYSDLYLLIHVIADFATQTSLEIAMKKCEKIVAKLKAREVWFIRHVPVRAIYGKKGDVTAHTYKLIKLTPERHTYAFSFAL